MQQPQPKPSLWHRYRHAGCGWQGLIGCMSLVAVVLIVFICAVGTPAFVRGFTSAALTPTSGTAIAPQPTATSTPFQCPKCATATRARPTPTTTRAPAATHGRPRMGGIINDFYGKYGTPSTAGNGTDVVWFLPDQIMIAATPDIINTVVAVTVVGPDSWDEATTLNFCSQFLPSDAQEFNRTPPSAGTIFIDYHSSMGEIVNMLTATNCVMSVSTS